MKIAILHDYFDKTGGGERLVINLARALDADIYTGFIEKDKTFGTKGIKIKSLGISPKGNALLRGKKIDKAFGKLRLQNYDFYIFSGVWCTSAAKNHRPNLIYLHTIPRFAYDLRSYYSKKLNPVSRFFFNRFVDGWKPDFERNIRHFDKICANSENVRNRLKKYLGSALYSKSVAVYTGFDTNKFYFNKEGDFYLSPSRLDELKRIDVIIKAFKKNGKRLVVASDGPDAERLEKMAEGCKNIEFAGRVSDQKLLEMYANCKATVIAAVDEDLGLVPIESNASGKPCAAVLEGGFLETIKEGFNGVFFEPNPASLNDAIERLEKIKWSRKRIIESSRRYDISVFGRNMRRIINDVKKNYGPTGTR